MCTRPAQITQTSAVVAQPSDQHSLANALQRITHQYPANHHEQACSPCPPTNQATTEQFSYKHFEAIYHCSSALAMKIHGSSMEFPCLWIGISAWTTQRIIPGSTKPHVLGHLLHHPRGQCQIGGSLLIFLPSSERGTITCCGRLVAWSLGLALTLDIGG